MNVQVLISNIWQGEEEKKSPKNQFCQKNVSKHCFFDRQSYLQQKPILALKCASKTHNFFVVMLHSYFKGSGLLSRFIPLN